MFKSSNFGVGIEENPRVLVPELGRDSTVQFWNDPLPSRPGGGIRVASGRGEGDDTFLHSGMIRSRRNHGKLGSEGILAAGRDVGVPAKKFWEW